MLSIYMKKELKRKKKYNLGVAYISFNEEKCLEQFIDRLDDIKKNLRAKN